LQNQSTIQFDRFNPSFPLLFDPTLPVKVSTKIHKREQSLTHPLLSFATAYKLSNYELLSPLPTTKALLHSHVPPTSPESTSLKLSRSFSTRSARLTTQFTTLSFAQLAFRCSLSLSLSRYDLFTFLCCSVLSPSFFFYLCSLNQPRATILPRTMD
jgi:hypothetical protein